MDEDVKMFQRVKVEQGAESGRCVFRSIMKNRGDDAMMMMMMSYLLQS